jgi:hypothetical protein
LLVGAGSPKMSLGFSRMLVNPPLLPADPPQETRFLAFPVGCDPKVDHYLEP